RPALFNLSQLAISGGQRATKRWAADWLDPRPGERLLDVCCGTGEYCAVWDGAGVVSRQSSVVGGVGQSGSGESGVGSRESGAPAYLGIDLNARYIAYARKRYGNSGRAFRALDATRLNLPAGSFDKAIFANSLHHFPDDLNRGILREIARVLRPGGRLVLVDMVGDHPGRARRFFLDRDRGRYLRPLDRQLALVAEHFALERSATFDAGFTPQTIVAATPRPSGGG
ncbi:MAG TPA: methyltransferase domain-containing protein, partial [Thermomicrobiales bacterium]|nr:methyltransferase domain-containing protein [Thermomicrobiales bacterium]